METLRAEPRHAFAAMDSMRALAAILVAISHIRDLMMVGYTGGRGLGWGAFYFLTGFGHAGVIVFFVLSGFWITKSVARRTADPAPFWPGFLIDRLSRLWLVLIPVLVVGGILDWYGLHVLHSPIYEGHSGALSLAAPITLAASVFAANIAFLQTLTAPIFGSNGPLWSLAFEFWYYLWFPALWLLVRGRPSPMLLSVLMAIIYPAVLFGFVSWLCGALLYAMVDRARQRPVGRFVGYATLAIGLIATVGMLALIRSQPLWWLDPMLAFAFAVLLLGLCLANLPMPGLRVLSAYGAKSSFSLYAFHFPVATLAAAVLLRHGRMTPSVGAVGIVLLVLGFVCAIGFIFSLATEAHTAKVRMALSWLLLGHTGAGCSYPASFTGKDMTDRLDEVR